MAMGLKDDEVQYIRYNGLIRSGLYDFLMLYQKPDMMGCNGLRIRFQRPQKHLVKMASPPGQNCFSFL